LPLNTTVAPESGASGASPLDVARGDPEAFEGSKGSTDTFAFKMEQNGAVVKRRIVAIMILAGDIGGTKTLLGLFRSDGPRPSRVAVAAYPTLDYSGLPEIVDIFLTSQNVPAPIQRAAFGVAGPVIDQSAEMTNVPWRVEAAELITRFNFRHVRLLNDLEAMAYSVPVLTASELQQLQAGERGVEGNVALIAAGTGLGTSLLHWVDGRYVPLPSEGGHTDFAARTDREIELLQFLRARFGRAEVEHVLSGPGILNLSDFTHSNDRCATLQTEVPDLPAEVSKSALEGSCDCCVEALDLFVSIYGAVAGNFALAAVTRGGVYIGGGIAPRILPAFAKGTFIEAFNAKEPMTGLLRAMSVYVILNPDAGLLGAAVYASRLQ
jgi:glucokinase